MRTFMTALAVAAVAIAATGCATKKYVQTSIGEVNDKVDSLGRSVEQTQERTRANEGKIAEVDTKATAAGTAAQQANSAAAAANNAAAAANNNATGVGTKLADFDKQSRRLVLEVVINTASGGFETSKADLPGDAKTQIDQLISRLQQDPKNVYIEIEGHTDSTGPAELNEKLGLDRAEAAKRYLYEKHQIPLHKMNVISYGPSKPVADNKTKEGRAQNRRIVIRVLA
jgi:outer membrane protein OmpA-like peptidoglycan-associated protein